MIQIQAISGTTILGGIACAKHVAIRGWLNHATSTECRAAVAFPNVCQHPNKTKVNFEDYLPYSTPKNLEPLQKAAHDSTVSVSLAVAPSPSARPPEPSL